MKNGNYQYEVTMRVPLGKRNGNLNITISKNKLFGFLTMFTEQLPISDGFCDGDHLTFSGKMKTLLNTFDYIADGIITNDQIELVFRTERGDYPAIGRKSLAIDREIIV